MQTPDEIRRRVRAVARGKIPAQRRYPAELKALAVDHARQAQATGRNLAAVAKELGLSDQTLRTWIEAEHGGGLRPVVIQPDPEEPPPITAGVPVLVTPEGFRVEGLDLAQLTSLLRTLR